MNVWMVLLLAIVAEVIGTSLLKMSDGFSRWLPTLGMAACYLFSFYCLSLVLKHMPMGIAYAIWSGVGIVLITLTGWLAFRQALDLPALIGMGMIVGGVIVINVFSQTAGH
ncbi:MAG: SMR family transporter [Neisseria sp.]|nr:SMR family transporter [Neisseria sp.]